MFLTLLTSNTQWVLASATVLGIVAGVIGCFSYWKKQSLMSDSLAHAALPGVIIAFLLIGEQDLLYLITGAAISALIGAFFIQWITTTTKITDDTAMGIILSVFYGLGIMLLTIANRSGGNQAGLESFIYGQAAAMVRSDVWTMLILAGIVLLIVLAGFKEWKLFLFDPEFAKGIGLSLKGMNLLYTVMLVTTIVIGIQAVGVILIAALLIIPSVSARYWTHSFKTMLLLAALFGGASGAIGTGISTLGNGWPTGPFIVVTAAAFFCVSLIFGKEKGILVNYIQFKNRKKQAENEEIYENMKAQGAEK